MGIRRTIWCVIPFMTTRLSLEPSDSTRRCSRSNTACVTVMAQDDGRFIWSGCETWSRIFWGSAAGVYWRAVLRVGRKMGMMALSGDTRVGEDSLVELVCTAVSC